MVRTRQVCLLSASALLISAAAVSSCGGSNSTTTTPAPMNAATISIVGQNGTQAFTPNPAPFGAQSVVFTNTHTVTHHIVLNDLTADFGDLVPGVTSRAVMIPAAGTNFHCTIHPGMIGSIAASAGSAPPPCVGAYCTGY